nr:MAG: polyprotein [Wufeng shrew iflavirus 17]
MATTYETSIMRSNVVIVPAFSTPDRAEKSAYCGISYATIASRHGVSLGRGERPRHDVDLRHAARRAMYAYVARHMAGVRARALARERRARWLATRPTPKWLIAYRQSVKDGFKTVGGARAFRATWCEVKRPHKRVVLRAKIPDVAPRPAQPTAGKQQKRRATFKSHKSDAAQGAAHWYPVPVKPRSTALLIKLRIAIAQLRLVRLPVHARPSVEYWIEQALVQPEGLFGFDTAADKLGKHIESFGDKIVDSLKTKTKDTMSSIRQATGIVLPTILTAAAGNSVQSWLVGCVAVLIQLGVINQDSFKDIVDGLTRTSTTTTQPGTQGVVAEPEGPGHHPPDPDEHSIRAVTLIWQAIAVFVGVRADINKRDEVSIMSATHTLMKEMRSAAMGTNGFLNMFKNFWEVVKSGYTWCCTKIGGTASEEILHLWEHAPAIEAACKEANGLLARPLLDFMNPTVMHRLVAVSTCVDKCVTELLTFDHTEVVLTNYFTSLQTALRSRLVACKRSGYNILTRETPFVLYFVGEPGIGKSEMTSIIAATLAKVGNIPVGDAGPIYCKSASSEYWDGYNCQPFVVFDDFMQVKMNTPEHSDEANLLQLKSSAIFRPPMAAVEDKGRIAAPAVVMCLSNTAFPQSTHLTCQEALWRRRDSMWQVMIRKGKRVPDANSDVDPTFEHLVFGRYGNPQKNTNPSAGAYTFKEMLAQVASEYKVYHTKEVKLCAEREKALSAILTARTTSEEGASVSYEHIEQLLGRVNIFKEDDIHPDMLVRLRNFRSRMSKSFKDTFSKFWNVKKARTENLLDDVIEETQLITTQLVNENVAGHDLEALTDPYVYETAGDEMKAAIKRRWLEERPTIPWPFDVPTPEGPDPTPTLKPEDIQKEDVPKEAQPPVNAEMDPMSSEVATIVEEAIATFSKPEEYDITKWPLTLFTVKFLYDRAGSELGRRNLVNHSLGLVPCIHAKADWRNLKFFDHTKLLVSCPIHDDNHINATYKSVSLIPCSRQCILADPFLSMNLGLSSQLFTKAIKNFTRYVSDNPNDPIVAKMNTAKLDLIPNVLHLPSFPDFGKIIKRMASKTMSALSTAAKWLWKVLKWFGMYIAPVVALLGLGFAGYKTVKWLRSERDEEGKRAPFTSYMRDTTSRDYRNIYDTATSWRRMPVDEAAAYAPSPKRSVLSPRSMVVRCEANDMHERISTDTIKRNTIFLEVNGRDANTGEDVCAPYRIFGICGQWYLAPKHYLHQIGKLDPDTACGVMISCGKEYIVNPNAFRFYPFENSEFVMLFIPRVPPVKDVRKNIKTDRDWQQVFDRRMRIVETMPDRTVNQQFTDGTIQYNFSILIDGDHTVTIPRAIKYRWHGKGRCMSVVLDHLGFIIGFHIAGCSGTGYAEPVAKESFDDLSAIALDQGKDLIANIDPPLAVVETQMEVLGTVESKHTIRASSNSSIVASLIQGVFPIRTIPAPLKKCVENEWTDQLSAGVAHRGRPIYGFNHDDLRIGGLRFRDHIMMNVKPRWNPIAVRSVEDAVNGYPGVTCFKSIDLSTSEGFPYQCMRPSNATNKSWLLKHGDNPIKSQYLADVMAYNTEKRLRGECAQTVFVDCLKDARLPIEKANTPGKVRVFSVAPTDFLIQYRQYFADFIVSYVDARFSAHHAIGIAPETHDWTDMMRYLSEVGSKYLCGDYKNFGPGFDIESHIIANNVMRDWYAHNSVSTDEEQLIRKCMHHELEYPLHLCRNVVYRTICGMPSGSPVTTITNSMVNDIYIFTAWYGIMKDANYNLSTHDAMERHLRYVTFGDDIIMCVSDDAVEHFNNVTLQSWFAQYGVIYTDGAKSLVGLRPFIELHEITFLKRGIVPHPIWPGVLLGCVDKVSIEDAANWINKSYPKLELSQQGSCSALMLAHGHGPDYFNYVRDSLTAAWRETGYPISFRRWEDFDRLFFNERYNLLSANELRLLRLNRNYAAAPGEGPGVEEAPVNSTICDQQADTILQDHIPPLEACPPSFIRRMEDWCGVDHDESFERLVNRQVILDTQKWSTTDGLGSILKTQGVSAIYSLPSAVISKFKQTPSALPFLQYRYMRADMNVRVSINANKFMNGQLQVSWYYAHNLDNQYNNMRTTLETRSQLLGGIIDAGTSNSVDICIPYKNYRPWLHLAARADMETPAVLGELRIKVLSQLYAADTSANYCDVTIFISFKNARFMGLVSRDLNKLSLSDGEAEMFPMAASYIAVQLFNKYADTNRDKPPLTGPPHPMTPLTTPSMAVGTGCGEPVLPLRLDARGMVPHPDGIDTIHTFSELAGVKALVARFTWDVNSDLTKPLISIPGEPLCKIDDSKPKIPGSSYYGSELILEEPPIYAYRVPPVGVVSDLFSYWRGSLTFEFHVVGSQYHTGRLLCAYIPHYAGEVTRAQAQAGPYVIFDIHDERVFTFDTPYLADKPWWPVQGANGEVTDGELGAPGFLCIYVLNPLIKMSSISDRLDVLIYCKAGPGFEVSVPRQPSLVLPWNALYYDPQKFYADSGYAPYYPGGWRNFYGGDKSIMRYGPGSDHIGIFSKLEYGDEGVVGGWYYYQMTDKDNEKVKHYFKWGTSGATLNYTQLALVPFDDGDGYGHVYMAVFSLSSMVASSPYCPFKEVYTDGKIPNYEGAITVVDDTSPYCIGNPPLTRRMVLNTQIPKPKLTSTSSDEAGFTLIEGEAPPQVTATGIMCATQPVVMSTSSGLDTFGENFNDIKNYLRRYELVGRVTTDAHDMVDGSSVLSIPVLPQGYVLQPSEDETIRYSRDGGHNIVASAFRFFRGSMNFKITIPSKTTMWIQHRPDRHVEYTSLSKQTDTRFDAVMLKDYATTLNSAHNSPMISVNIPFYQPGCLGLLQQPDVKAKLQARRAMSLGELTMGFVPDQLIAKEYVGLTPTISIYNAVGDDMRFSTFVGFPPMCRLVDLAIRNNAK